MPRGSLPAPLLLPASERVGQATRGTHVGCRAAFLVVLLFFTNSALLFFPPVFPAAIFVVCVAVLLKEYYTLAVTRGERKKSRGELPLPLGSYCFKAQRQSSLDEDFEKTRTYTYIINMYTCRHFCVVARIYI